MFVRRSPSVTRRAAPRVRAAPGRRAAPRRRAALDAAGLILELEMAALVRRAGESLRQDPDDADQPRSWWRRLFGKKRIG
jgi:hypothetical protein